MNISKMVLLLMVSAGVVFSAEALPRKERSGSGHAVLSKDSRMYISQADLKAMGLVNHDSTMPFVRLGTDDYWIYLSEGGALDGKHSHIVRLKTSLAEIDRCSVHEVEFSGIPDAGVNQSNGWKAWLSNLYAMGPNEWLAILHLEDQDTGFKEVFRMGAAYSNDGGRTFKFLGFVLSPHLADEIVKRGNCTGLINIAGAGLRWDKDYLYVYFSDMSKEDRSDRHLAVARVAKADLERNARQGVNTVWHKYYDGAWNEKGLGGRSAHLGNLGEYHTSVVYNTYIERWVTFSIGDGFVTMLRSADPLNFNVPVERVCAIPPDCSAAYFSTQSCDGDEPDYGQKFHVYYRLASKKHTYDTVRLTLSFE